MLRMKTVIGFTVFTKTHPVSALLYKKTESLLAFRFSFYNSFYYLSVRGVYFKWG